MKKNDITFLLGSIAFSILFYEQNAGVNWLLFALLVCTSLVLLNAEKIFDPQWWYYAGMAVITTSMVMFQNSVLSILASIAAIIMLCGKTANRDNSVFIAFGFSVFSLSSSLVYWIIDLATTQNDSNKTEKQRTTRIFFGVAAALLIALVFFFLYREANPLFKDLTKNINFDWLSVGWILFTFWGFLILYGLIRNRRIRIISDMDSEALRPITEKKLEGGEKMIKHGAVTALSLFVILNGMLLVINILDFHNIFINQTLPKGITLSNFVHQAVWSVVVSIIVATLFIMIFFRDDLNFNSYGKRVKFFVYAWIIQSIIMVLTTMIRNSWYIQEYQLTELRISVYTFLVLSLIGLVLTFRKVALAQSAWYLVTRNFSAWFLLLCLSSCVNWVKVITLYNIAHATEIKKLDSNYLSGQTDANIPELVELYHLKDTTLVIKNYWDTPTLDWKLYEASEKIKKGTWQSFNFRDLQNKEALRTIKFMNYEKK